MLHAVCMCMCVFLHKHMCLYLCVSMCMCNVCVCVSLSYHTVVLSSCFRLWRSRVKKQAPLLAGPPVGAQKIALPPVRRVNAAGCSHGAAPPPSRPYWWNTAVLVGPDEKPTRMPGWLGFHVKNVIISLEMKGAGARSTCVYSLHTSSLTKRLEHEKSHVEMKKEKSTGKTSW